MEDLYGTTPSSGTGVGSESEDIASILNQLLQSSSSSPPFSSAPATTSFTGFKAKYAHLLHSPPPSFSAAAEGLLGSEDRLRFGRSENRTEPEPDPNPNSGLGFSDPSRGFFGAEAKEGAENAFSDANTSLKARRVSPENDLGDFSCDSEGQEGSDVPSNSARLLRGSSKRSRAAEVHNLSEKRRRSRINEKMKALQNLIPNSNKTDKASMLDEAIEYLKQLQLQVQMLSMRNGLSLHPVCLPGVLQPMQLCLPQTGLNFNDVLKFPNPNTIGINAFSGHQDTPMQSHYSLPPIANVPTSEPSLPFEQPSHTHTHTHFRPVNLTPSSTEFLDHGKMQERSSTLPSKSPDI